MGNIRAQVTPPDIVSRRERARKPLRRAVGTARTCERSPAIAHIAGFRYPPAGQFALKAQIPPLIVRRQWLGIKECDGLSEEGLRALRCSQRFQNAIRERI